MNRALAPLPAAAQGGAAHTQAMLLGLGCHTLAAALTVQGRQHQAGSAEDRAYNAGRLEAGLVFCAVLQESAGPPTGGLPGLVGLG